MKHQFNWTIGDWSNDGHSNTKLFQIRSNHSAKEIQDAYNRLGNRLNWWFHDEVCSEYMEFEIDPLTIEKLEEFGIEVSTTQLGPEGFVHLFFRFMQLELPELEYEIMTDHSDQLFGFWIGNDLKEKTEGYANYMFGYGLFEFE